MSETELRAHPAYSRIYRIFYDALHDWHTLSGIQDAARTLGMNARAYAEARLMNQNFGYASIHTSGAIDRKHLDLAYEQAVTDICEVVAA